MLINPKLYLLICFLMLGLTGSFSQPPDLQFHYFSRSEGVFNSSIYAVNQDSTGYIWIATRDGLYRYDGYEFVLYTARQNDSASLPSKSVNCLYTDSKNRLWAGTSLGVALYEADQDHFIRVADNRDGAGLSDLSINQIGEAPDGSILVCSSSGIFSYDEENKIFVSYIQLENTQINHFVVDKPDVIWLACSAGQGLVKYYIKSGKWDKVLAAGNYPPLHADISYLALNGNSLYLATLGEGLKMYNTETGKLQHYHYNNADEAMVVSVYIDREGNAWSIDHTGLKFVDENTGYLFGYYPNFEISGTVRANAKRIFQDRQGNYWVNHDPGGVGISVVRKGFRHYSHSGSQPWITENSSITALCEDMNGSLWIGYHTGGIDIFEWQTGSVKRLRHNPNNKSSLGRGSILCLYRDSHGTMWAGTYFDGLHRYDEKTGRFIHYSHNPADNSTIAGNDVRSIVEDNDGNLWIAIHGKGVDKFDRKLQQFIHYSNASGNLSNDWTFQVIIDHVGDLWVATSWGLNRLRKGQRTFESWLNNIDDSTSLINNLVNTLYEDDRNNLWIGTASGLCRYDRHTGFMVHYPQVLGNLNISGIVSDNDGLIWISSLHGLTRLNADDNSAITFTSDDGLLSDEFNPRSLYKNNKNELFFGGTKSIEVFTSDELEYNTIPPAIIIDRIKIFDRELTPANSDILNKHISRTSKIVLRHQHNNITLGFKALNFINPHANRYACFLEGFDKSWQQKGTSREAVYTNLDPGRYTFRAIASNNDGYWNMKGAKLEIVILPAWYATLIFRLLLAGLLALAVFGFIRLRTKNLQKQKILLEKAVQEKTKNLAEANLELQKLNATKDKLFSIIAHDLNSPFNTILGFSEMLATRYETLSDKDKMVFAKAINSSSERVHVLLQNLLLWTRSQTSQIKPYPENTDIPAILKEISALVKETLKTKQITLEIICPETITAWADKEMVKTILRNLLSNAIKFTPKNGNIIVRVEDTDSHIKISVTDSGLGISSAKIREILSNVLTIPEQGTEGEMGSGLGLTLCKDFIAINQGEFHINSKKGEGSTFAFTLPVGSI